MIKCDEKIEFIEIRLVFQMLPSYRLTTYNGNAINRDPLDWWEGYGKKEKQPFSFPGSNNK